MPSCRTGGRKTEEEGGSSLSEIRVMPGWALEGAHPRSAAGDGPLKDTSRAKTHAETPRVVCAASALKRRGRSKTEEGGRGRGRDLRWQTGRRAPSSDGAGPSSGKRQALSTKPVPQELGHNAGLKETNNDAYRSTQEAALPLGVPEGTHPTSHRWATTSHRRDDEAEGTHPTGHRRDDEAEGEICVGKAAARRLPLTLTAPRAVHEAGHPLAGTPSARQTEGHALSAQNDHTGFMTQLRTSDSVANSPQSWIIS